MKKIGLILGAVAVALLATACEMRFYMDLTVDEDGSGVMSFDLAANRELREMTGEWMDLGELLDAPPDQLCDVDPLNDGDFQGARMTCAFASLEELAEMTVPIPDMDDMGQPLPDPGSGFQLERDGDTFRFRMDASDLNEFYDQSIFEDMPMDEADMEMDLDWGSIFDFRFTAALPGEIVSHNATVVEGNTLTWWFPTAEPWLMAESRVSSGLSPAALWSLIGVGAVIVIMLAIMLMARSRRTGDGGETDPDPDGPMEDGTEPVSEAPADPEPDAEAIGDEEEQAPPIAELPEAVAEHPEEETDDDAETDGEPTERSD